jgi:hypothetical protein
MTIDEYMDPNRFPATTQAGLGPKDQLMIDAVNYDALKEAIENGEELTESQKAVWAEFEAKMQHHARLTRELAAEEKAKGGK